MKTKIIKREVSFDQMLENLKGEPFYDIAYEAVKDATFPNNWQYKKILLFRIFLMKEYIM